MNTAADSLCQIEKDPNEKIFSKNKEDIPTKPIEENIESRGIAQEESVLFDTTDQQENTHKELWKRKEEARNAIPNGPPVITVSCYYAKDLQKDTTFVEIAQLTKPSRIPIEQDSDPTLLNFKRWATIGRYVGPTIWRKSFLKRCTLHAKFQKQEEYYHQR